MNKNKKRVAVYGSLRKGLGNYSRHLRNATHLGDFETNPIFNLYDLGAYPGLKLKGNTSVYMEVFEVTDDELDDINRLEGYVPNSKDNNFYDRVTLDTPYGEAYTYIYQRDVDKDRKVESGNWTEYLKERRV